MKKFIKAVIIIIVSTVVVTLSGCEFTANEPMTKEETTKITSSVKKPSSTTYKKSYSSFTNRYGTATTVCAHSGCSSYIASSGDTNCCTKHSNRCLECKCYIDEDAMFCLRCIENALS